MARSDRYRAVRIGWHGELHLLKDTGRAILAGGWLGMMINLTVLLSHVKPPLSAGPAPRKAAIVSVRPRPRPRRPGRPSHDAFCPEPFAQPAAGWYRHGPA